MSLSLAVISDIHVGKGSRAQDLCPAGLDKVDKQYVTKFLDFVQRRALRADYLLIPGDITDEAQPNEVETASNFVLAAAKALQIEATGVMVVPGNHDVDWKVLGLEDTTGVRRAQRYDPLRSTRFCFDPILCNGARSLLDQPYFRTWQYDDLLVCGYNSSHHDDPNKQHVGLLDPSHVESLRKALAGIPHDTRKVRLFLIHHHPIQYTNPAAEPLDQSILVNAEELRRILSEFHFDIVVHGHKHFPRFSTCSTEGTAEVAILCAGSFSAEIETRWSGVISNQFHLLTIDGRDSSDGVVQGNVKSWTYVSSRGWEPSNKMANGIPHIERFGSYVRPDKLKAYLRPILAKRFKVSDYAEWSVLAQRYQRLSHLRPEVIMVVLDELGRSMGFRRHGDDPDRMVLLKDG